MKPGDKGRKGIDRRDFMKKVGVGALAVGAVGCLPKVDGDWQTCQKPDGGAILPASNRVVEVISTTVVDAQTLEITHPEELPGMVSAGLLALTGADTLADAWAAVLPDRKSGEVIGLKVNALLAAEVKTSVPLVRALADSLQADAGVEPEAILVWDRTDKELIRAGLTQEQLGVRCQGTLVSASDKSGPGYEPEAVCLSDQPIQLSTLLTRTTQHLINVPVLKSHGVSGFTGCLKNHYGSFGNPGDFHTDAEQHIARLNVLPQVARVLRLCVMDALIGVCGRDTADPADCAPGRLLFGFDPVAVDRRATEIRDEMRAAKDPPQGPGMPAAYLDIATELGAGAADYERVLIET